jgi:hypothetical protein
MPSSDEDEADSQLPGSQLGDELVPLDEVRKSAQAAKDASRARLATAEAALAGRRSGESRPRRRRTTRAFAAAESAVAGADAERTELARSRRAEALRPTWDAAARLERQLAICRGDLASAIEAVEQNEGVLAAIASTRDRLHALGEPIRVARIAARIVIDGPAASTSVSTAKPALSVQVAAAPGVRRGAGGGLGGLGAWSVSPRAAAPREVAWLASPIVAEAEARARAATGDAAWIVARAGTASEIAGWPDLDSRYGQHGAIGDAIAGIDRSLRGHADTRGRLVRNREASVAEHQQAGALLEEARRKAAFHQGWSVAGRGWPGRTRSAGAMR